MRTIIVIALGLIFLTSCKNETYYEGKGVVVAEERTLFGGVQVKVLVDTAGDGSNQISFWASPAGLTDNHHRYSQGDTVNVEFNEFSSWVGPLTEKSKQGEEK